jgi:hypothetical protein
MKRLLAAALLALAIAPPVHANADRTAFCAAVGALAYDIMRRRQDGLAMTFQMEASQSVDSSPEMHSLASSLILGAYDVPRWNSDLTRRRAAEDYRNDVEVACFRGVAQ